MDSSNSDVSFEVTEISDTTPPASPDNPEPPTENQEEEIVEFEDDDDEEEVPGEIEVEVIDNLPHREEMEEPDRLDTGDGWPWAAEE
jgi:hypothetical protein